MCKIILGKTSCPVHQSAAIMRITDELYVIKSFFDVWEVFAPGVNADLYVAMSVS